VRNLYLLAVLILAACASPVPITYNQGALRPPPPPSFNPTTDAPITIGQPGYTGPGIVVEPNPRPKRILPPTRGPGIWAGDGPKGPATKFLGSLVGIGVPEPEDAELIPAVKRCGDMMNDVAHDSAAVQRELALVDVPTRICAVASILQSCMFTMRYQYERTPARDEAELLTLRRAEDYVRSFVLAACYDPPRTKAKRLLDVWVTAWTIGKAHDEPN